MPVAKVVRLPPVSMEKPIEAVSATIGRTFSIGRPSTSAAIIAIEAREPPMSGLPVTTTARAVLADVHRRGRSRRRR